MIFNEAIGDSRVYYRSFVTIRLNRKQIARAN